jgi:hypothetical protein
VGHPSRLGIAPSNATGQNGLKLPCPWVTAPPSRWGNRGHVRQAVLGAGGGPACPPRGWGWEVTPSGPGEFWPSGPTRPPRPGRPSPPPPQLSYPHLGSRPPPLKDAVCPPKGCRVGWEVGGRMGAAGGRTEVPQAWRRRLSERSV